MAPVSLVYRLRLALGEIEIHSLWDMLASILTFVAIFIATQLRAGLEASVLPFCVVPLLVLVGNGVHLFHNHPALIPRLSLVSSKEALAMVRGGARFFVLNALLAASFSFDSVLAVHLLSADQAAEFGVVQRVAMGMQTLLTLSLIPFWPRFLTALQRGQKVVAIQTLKVAIFWAMSLSLPISILVLTCGSYVIGLWTGGVILISGAVAFAAAIWIPLSALAAVAGTLMNIPALIAVQIRLLFSSVIVCFAAKVLLSGWLGSAGLFWGNILGSTIIMVIPAFFIIYRFVGGVR
jgi:hypothetical protein